MFILIFFIVVALGQFIGNKIMNLSIEGEENYTYSKSEALYIALLFIFSVLAQIFVLKYFKDWYWYICLGYLMVAFIMMVIIISKKKITIEKQRTELQQVFEILQPTLGKNAELDFNNPPFKLGYDKGQINRISINIDPNTFKETVASNLCLSLNKFLPTYSWVNEFDFASRLCHFVGTPLPPPIARYKGSWLRPTEYIPIALSGLGELGWTINSVNKKKIGRSLYYYDDGDLAQSVILPSAPQAMAVGSTGGGKSIYVEQEIKEE